MKDLKESYPVQQLSDYAKENNILDEPDFK